jgi:hypothetical protein
MRTKVWGWLIVFLCLPLLLVLGLAGSAQSESATLQLTPDVVEINSFFQGRDVMVTGTLPAGLGAVVEVLGPTTEEHLMRKGRRGPLWMNVGQISVSGVPSLYIVLSSAADLLAGNRLDAPWGFPSLIQHIGLAGDVQRDEQDKFKHQFLVLKESQKLYGAWPEGLKLSPAGDGQKVTGKFWLPSNIRPDTYKVCLTTVKDGQAVDKVCTDLPVQMVGFPAFLMTMAYQHAALYGLLAIIIAIVVGAIMGYLFKGGGGH